MIGTKSDTDNVLASDGAKPHAGADGRLHYDQPVDFGPTEGGDLRTTDIGYRRMTKTIDAYNSLMSPWPSASAWAAKSSSAEVGSAGFVLSG